jgi:tRNA-Thr(GGU) m(6)t(6)A37 methyltransferase TsaA
VLKKKLMKIEVEAIGIIHTPYKQKFAIPRQPGLAKDGVGVISFSQNYADVNCLRGIEAFSHLWLIFQFHQTASRGWSPLVRPPRLGGNDKMGVFATRSTFRPNNLGLSVVEFDSLKVVSGKPELIVRGVDLLDGTPILDIKPYIPYADAIADATAGFAQQNPPADMKVEFSALAHSQLDTFQAPYPKLVQLISQVLAQDPRPAYKKSEDDSRVYGMSLYELNIRWQVIDGINRVLDIEAV